MPELPEVERGRGLADSVARGCSIIEVRCTRDPIVFDGVSAARWKKALLGKRVERVCRRGKQLWFELDAPPHPLFHFGMTGSFRVQNAAPIRYRADGRKPLDDSWPPKWTKIHLVFDGGGELVMTNKRRLGRIRLRDDPAREPPISKLGFDPLLDLPSPRRFAELVSARSAVIKALLLDQSFAAGVGNWIADEVLYQARIDPRRRANALAVEEVKRIRAKLKHVIETAVRVDAEKDRLPKSWLFHHRWGKNADAVTARGERIVHETIGGRTTAWAPEVQS